MSEAELPKTVDETPETLALPAPSEPPRRSNAPAWLALLLALGAAGAAGWSVWQLRQQVAVQPAAESGLSQALAELSSENRALLVRLEKLEQAAPAQRQLQGALTDLQAQQQAHAQQLERLQGDGRSELRLAEAEHLLRLASLRLSALQDVDSAVALVEGADEVLREQNDPAAFAARRELARALEALRSRPQPDRTGLYLSLAALREEVFALTDSVPVFERSQPAPEEGQAHWSRWLDQLSGYVRIEFDAEQDIRPLLAGQSLDQVRLALGLALEQAQWAVLNGEAQVYAKAIDQAREILESHFSVSRSEVAAVSGRLQELAQAPVSFTSPDLTPALQAFQAYLVRRQGPAPVAEDEGESAAETAQ